MAEQKTGKAREQAAQRVDTLRRPHLTVRETQARLGLCWLARLESHPQALGRRGPVLRGSTPGGASAAMTPPAAARSGRGLGGRLQEEPGPGMHILGSQA